MDIKIQFEWDPVKAESNLRKHHISFETATRVFFDPFAVIETDRFENGEYRWRTLGTVFGHMLVLVAHTTKNIEDGTEVVRIISARRATPDERKNYEQNRSL